MWLGSLLLLTILLASGRRLTWQGIRTSWLGGVLLGTEIAFFFTAIKRTSVADVTVISALQPALVMLVAGRLFGERVTGRDLWWSLVSLAGVVLVTVGSAGTPVWTLSGDLLAVGSLIAWTAYFVASKRARATVPAIEYTTVAFLVASFVVTPLAIASGQSLVAPGLDDWVLLAVFVLGASGGHLLVSWAHSSVDVTVSSLLMLGLPVVSSLAALVILDEPLLPLTIVGGLVVLGSLAAIVSRAARVGGEEDLGEPQV